MASNPRLNVAVGRLELMPDDGIVLGQGASQIMAAFVHCHDGGGRFNDGRLGAWYASADVTTSLFETQYHLTKRLAHSDGGFPNIMQMRELITTVNKPLIDVRGSISEHPGFYEPDNYAKSQDFANSVRYPFSQSGEPGIVYDSVRHEGGENICIFEPSALDQPIVQGDHYQFNWDAEGKFSAAKLTNLDITN